MDPLRAWYGGWYVQDIHHYILGKKKLEELSDMNELIAYKNWNNKKFIVALCKQSLIFENKNNTSINFLLALSQSKDLVFVVNYLPFPFIFVYTNAEKSW